MENYYPMDMVEKISAAIQKEYLDLKCLNVMVLGKTGVGKSTLINNVFSEHLAETGIGKPVTTMIRRIEKPDFPLVIYDTPGLELGGDHDVKSLLQEVLGEIQKGVLSEDVSKAIHCIWYCVNTTSHRFEEEEALFISELQNQSAMYRVPVIVVLTQSFSKADAQEMKSAIGRENLPVSAIIPVLAEKYQIDEEYSVKPYGLDTLAEVMNSVIPEAVRKTFTAIQCANLELKRDRARAVVGTAAATAAATGAVPIPFSDAALLIPEQIAMIAGITAVFGLPIERGSILALISATIGTAGTTVLGKTVVSGILKLIPVVGTAIGGAISGSAAAALTAALGEAYIIMLMRICKGEITSKYLQSSEGRLELARLFSELLKLKRKSNGQPEENAEFMD